MGKRRHPDAPWKKAERRLAAMFGSVRRPLSGGLSRSGGRDDSMHERLFISSKYSSQDSFPLFSLWKQEQEKAKIEGKTVVLGFTRRNFKGRLLVIHSDDLEEVAIEYLEHLETINR